MGWNEAAYEILGGSDESAEARDELAELEGWIGGPLPESVREWYLLGGDRRLTSISSTLVTQTRDFTSPRVSRLLDNGYLLLETDTQHCCRWVVAVSAAHGDPPVYLIDPNDDTCTTRSRYAATFSDYAFTASWDATLWKGVLSADFDHPLPPDALDTLRLRLTALPTTHGWAMNQGCDAVYRFSGPAKVAVAVTGSTALWSAIAAPSTARRDALATLIGATPGDSP
ncbi:SMI1/KNR4 family protein [Plantactinospora sp. S1510]|uniref:SMI1/KNR4 family protein n=1 Tax=Plantactinospora alkalitolerans TaxID=2789879 RepID=A0ABS0H929_9ACTN|nr:SMI1/KNR4 family protein [Plantactinospora alkalitolerans]MBF9134983.1 SMI1/KNR4 family protein [Plantactinospora alkalitolerans]